MTVTPTTPAALNSARAGRVRRVNRTGYLFVAPFLLLFLLFQLIPVGYAVWQSVHATAKSGLGFGAATTSFVGLANFARVAQDQEVISGTLRVVVFGIVQVPVMLGLALLMALLLDSAVARFKQFFQLAAFLPYAVPGIIAAILWSFLYVPGISPIVDVLARLNLPHDFLSVDTVLWAIANITTWQWTGYNMLIIFAALQALPSDIFEAARMDGASGWVVNTQIKIPLVRPALILNTIFSIIGTLQLFAEPMIVRTLTANVTSKYTPNMAAYSAGFATNEPNYAAAIAVSLALATFLLSFAVLRLTQSEADS